MRIAVRSGVASGGFLLGGGWRDFVRGVVSIGLWSGVRGEVRGRKRRKAFLPGFGSYVRPTYGFSEGFLPFDFGQP